MWRQELLYHHLLVFSPPWTAIAKRHPGGFSNTIFCICFHFILSGTIDVMKNASVYFHFSKNTSVYIVCWLKTPTHPNLMWRHNISSESQLSSLNLMVSKTHLAVWSSKTFKWYFCWRFKTLNFNCKKLFLLFFNFLYEGEIS